MIFGRHDLIQDAPISHLDLLACRNTLMYLNAETQSRLLSRFHFALKSSGYLFMGKAEMLLTHGNLFAPVELRHRIFAPTPGHSAGGTGREAPWQYDTGVVYYNPFAILLGGYSSWLLRYPALY